VQPTDRGYAMNGEKKKFKIGYFADGPWGHNAFKLLVADPDIDIRFICPRHKTNDDTLKGFCEKFNIEYVESQNINSKEFISYVEKFSCDLFVSMSFEQIFKKEIIELPRLTTINCHAGKLPFYRGRNILNWALINDEKEFGITVHYVDEGIDTGDIILQKTYLITDEDTYESLLHIAYTECAGLLYQSVRNLIDGTALRKKQELIHPIGFYCGQRIEGDELLNWRQTSREIFNFVRAICVPGPVARSYIDGREIKINKVNMVSDAPQYRGIPGQVLAKQNGNLIVKTLDSFVEIVDYNAPFNIRVGHRFK